MLPQQILQAVECFQPIRPPHPGYNSRPPSQESSSLVDQKENNLSGGKSEIMSHENALDLLKNRYGSNHITVDNSDLKISDWQAAKKICHGVCFEINPEDYGAKQSDLDRLNRIVMCKKVVDYQLKRIFKLLKLP